MVINDVEIDMHERVWQQLLALPYSIALDEEGHLVMTPLQAPGLTFEQLADTHPILPDDLYWKVETNARNQIIMSPPPRSDHYEYGLEVQLLLHRLLPDGRPLPGLGVQTSDGTKEPDIVWVSRGRRRRHRGKISYPEAPEICVEVLSPSNSKREIEEKKALYLGAGAQEVWTCGRDGTMKFFNADGPLPASLLCPELPARIQILD